jgi:hypothetical protein
MLGKIETLVEAADELEKIADSITAWLDATRHLSLVVEGDHILGGSRHVGDDKADARIKFMLLRLKDLR